METMTRPEFIKMMQAYVEKLTNERKDIKGLMKTQPDNRELHHMTTKIDHEISAINNAIREMERQ